MAYCRNCGEEINNQAVVCPSCGVSQRNQQPSNNQTNVNDDGNMGWCLLGFCIPVVGLVLYLVWRDTQPNNAKSAGTGALISFILSIAVYFFVFVAALA